MATDPIVVECPKCRKKLRVPATAAGKSVRCPGCQAVTPVPAPAPQVVAVPVPPPPPAAPQTPEEAFSLDAIADSPRRPAKAAPPAQSPATKFYSTVGFVFAVSGAVISQNVVKKLLPYQPGDGIRMDHAVITGIVAGVLAGVGSGIGFLVYKFERNPVMRWVYVGSLVALMLVVGIVLITQVGPSSRW